MTLKVINFSFNYFRKLHLTERILVPGNTVEMLSVGSGDIPDRSFQTHISPMNIIKTNGQYLTSLGTYLSTRKKNLHYIF